MKKYVQQYLEKELGYTVCFHERDFLVGESIPANIEAAINHSRRMIMIISRFVRKLWLFVFVTGQAINDIGKMIW